MQLCLHFEARVYCAVVPALRSSRSERSSADVAQLVEHAIGNGEVSGSIPDVGSRNYAKVAQLVEHRFRKARVPGSIPGFGSKLCAVTN